MNKQRIRKSLKALFLDGLFTTFMAGATNNYITPYAIALKAKTNQIGLLGSLPGIATSLGQLKSADMAEKLGSRKKVILTFVFLHALMGLPIIFIPYLCKGYEVLALVIFVTLFTGFNALAAPAWSSLISEYIPSNKRGRYFSWYVRTFGIIMIVVVFAMGFILEHFKNNILRGFTIVFTFAFISRFIAWYFLTRLYEVPLEIKKDSYFSLFDFIRGIRKSNFARFVILIASLSFSLNLAAPFFPVFLLRDLKFNYFIYTILINSATIASLLTVGRWGRNADRFGNMKILKTTSFLIAAIPLLWVFNHSSLYLTFIYILSGFAGSGFNLCAGNFVYDAVSSVKRTRCLSYYNFLNSITTSIGAISGGYLGIYLPPLFGHRLLSLFFLSGILSSLIAIVFYRSLKEVRPVEEITTKDLCFRVVGIRPVDIAI